MVRLLILALLLLPACGGRAVIDVEDEGPTTLEPCDPGASRACYPGPQEAIGQGACVEGRETCLSSGEGYGPCGGAVLPSAQDCATSVDETCGRSAPTCTGATSWVVGATVGTSVGNDVAFTPDGGVVVVGSFAGTLHLGSSVLSAEPTSAFVIELDEAGEVVWSHAAISAEDSAATAVEVDGEGNVTIAGIHHTSASFAGAELVGGDAIASFLVQLAPDGSLRWARSYGSGSNTLAADVAHAPDGGFAVAGLLHGPADLGTGPLPFAGKQDVFVLAVDAAGVPRWARAFGGPQPDSLHRLDVAPSGQVLLAGSFEGTLALGNGVATLTSQGRDGFVVGFDSKGEATLASSFAGEGEDHPRSVATTPKGDILLTGLLDGPALTPTGPLHPSGPYATYLGRLSASGEPIADDVLGGPSTQSLGLDVLADAADQVLLLGSFDGPLDLGGGTTISDPGNTSFYITKRDPDLGHIWSRTFGDASLQRARRMDEDPYGGMVMTGDYTGALDFGEGLTLQGDPAGFPSFFVARFAP